MCVFVCVCTCVLEPVSFIRLAAMESPGDYITLEVSGNVCVCVCMCEGSGLLEEKTICPLHPFVSKCED